MDVSRVDPEEVLVDAGTVEPGDGDVSMDGVDEAWLRANQKDGDKVLVSIRLVCYIHCIPQVAYCIPEFAQQITNAHGPPLLQHKLFFLPTPLHPLQK